MADCVGPVTEVASSAWVPVLVLSIVSFFTAVGSAVHAVYSSRKSRLSLAAYQADVAYQQVSPAQEELAALAARVNRECDDKRHGATFERGYPYNYALYFASPAAAAAPEVADLNRCRRQLSAYWDGLFVLASGKQLPADFLDPERRPWVSRGEALRQLLEPLDVANFYRRRLGDYLAGNNRPARYVELEQLALQRCGPGREEIEDLISRLQVICPPLVT